MLEGFYKGLMCTKALLLANDRLKSVSNEGFKQGCSRVLFEFHMDYFRSSYGFSLRVMTRVLQGFRLRIRRIRVLWV